MNFKKIILGIIVPFVMISCGSKGEVRTTEIPEYPAMIMQKTNATLESVYPVTLKGKEDVEIRPRIDGWIEEVYVDEGAMVKAGQRMFKINSPQTIEAVRTAEAAIASAKAQVETAELDVKRITPLAQKGIVSQTQLDTYVNIHKTALAGLAQANAAMANARATLGWTNVTSPVNGVVGELTFRKGSLVNSANSLTTVANIDKVYAYFTMNEEEYVSLLNRTKGETTSEKIKNLADVELLLKDKTVYPHKGRIETIAGTVTSIGTVNFRAEFPNDGGVLRSGMSGRARIPELIEDIFILPQEATFSMQDKIVAYKVQGDTIAVQQLIEVLRMPEGKHYVVTSGLNVGEKVVTKSVATLNPNMRITPVIE